MRSSAIKATSIDELKAQLQQVRSQQFIPAVAIVFVHISFPMQQVADVLVQQNISYIAASSAGEFVDADLATPSIVAMLLDIPPSSFRTMIFDNREGKLASLAEQAAKEAKAAFAHPGFILLNSDQVNTDGEVIIQQIVKETGSDTPIFGGYASENLKFTETWISANGKVTTNGLVVLVLDGDKISMQGLQTGGWKPVGIIRTITKSIGNKVLMVDNEPALDLTARYLRIPVEEFEKGSSLITELNTRFQMQLYRKDSYPVMRAPIAADVQERSLTYNGEMPEGNKIQFSLLPSFDVIDNVIADYSRLRDETEEPDAMLLFSCKGREMILGPLITDEVERIRSLWKAPMAGFLSYGEIGRVKERTEQNGMMCSLVLLKEKQ